MDSVAGLGLVLGSYNMCVESEKPQEAAGASKARFVHLVTLLVPFDFFDFFDFPQP